MRSVVLRRADERARGRAWFLTLSPAERGDLGDAFVLAGFGHEEWGFETRPSEAFLAGADAARMLWEAM